MPGAGVFAGRAPEDDGGLLRQFIPAKVADNPALMEDDPGYISRLKGLGDEALVKAYLDGSFDIISGGMFDDLWTPKVHSLKPFRVPKSWYIDRSFDFGTAKPFCCSWYAESDGCEVTLADGTTRTFSPGSIFQIGEWYGWNGKPNEGCRLTPRQIAEGIVNIESDFGRKVNPGPADSSIFDTDAYGSSVAAHMENAGITWGRADKRPGSRSAGWVQIRGMLKNALDEHLEFPGLYFFEGCVHTIRTLSEAVRYQRNPEDVDPTSEDHPLDTLRYRVQNGSMVSYHSGFRPF